MFSKYKQMMFPWFVTLALVATVLTTCEIQRFRAIGSTTEIRTKFIYVKGQTIEVPIRLEVPLMSGNLKLDQSLKYGSQAIAPALDSVSKRVATIYEVDLICLSEIVVYKDCIRSRNLRVTFDINTLKLSLSSFVDLGPRTRWHIEQDGEVIEFKANYKATLNKAETFKLIYRPQVHHSKFHSLTLPINFDDAGHLSILSGTTTEETRDSVQNALAAAGYEPTNERVDYVMSFEDKGSWRFRFFRPLTNNEAVKMNEFVEKDADAQSTNVVMLQLYDRGELEFFEQGTFSKGSKTGKSLARTANFYGSKFEKNFMCGRLLPNEGMVLEKANLKKLTEYELTEVANQQYGVSPFRKREERLATTLKERCALYFAQHELLTAVLDEYSTE